MKIRANREEIVTVIKHAAKSYLKKHPKPGFFKLHTNQKKAEELISETNAFKWFSSDSAEYLNRIYQTYVYDKKGELSDRVALALRSFIHDENLTELEEAFSEAILHAGIKYSEADIAKNTLYSVFTHPNSAKDKPQHNFKL